ncbi:FISUMP domain-containing protein [Persicobacter sp. CCB-QB2]|uniref:FISUMP domain-containing protein n=1 Tax=Persicobacter sp. CCB-QB2 TaxID=1561025 RepID=UPI0006A95466|nr:FISUMP domain-containing protein [Persicobacter sp. CCB-QB2]
MKMELNQMFFKKSLIAMTAIAVLFTGCGDEGGDPPAPTPDPDPDPETELVLPGMKVSVLDDYLNKEASNTESDWHLYADVMKLKVEFSAPTGENEEAATVDAPVLTFTAGEEEVKYDLVKEGDYYVTTEIQDEFADQYLTGFDMVITAKVNDEDYEGTETEIVQDITVTTGKFGSVVFSFDPDNRYKTVQICDENGENCQVWMAENLRWTGTDGSIANRVYQIEGESDVIPDYVKNYGHLYTQDEKFELMNDYLEDSDWRIPTCTVVDRTNFEGDWAQLCKNVVGGDPEEGGDVLSPAYYSGTFEKLNNAEFWSDSFQKENWTNEYGFSLLGGGAIIYDGYVVNFKDRALFHVDLQDVDDSKNHKAVHFYNDKTRVYTGDVYTTAIRLVKIL